MLKSKLTDEQIAFALKQAELGANVEEVCRRMGIMAAFPPGGDCRQSLSPRLR